MGLSLQLITLFCLAVGIQAVCEAGFNWHDGICYHFPSGIFRRAEAINYCKLRRSTLPIIHSAEQEQYILDKFMDTHLSETVMWIGLTNNNGVYQWQDNSPIDYTNWASNNPTFQTRGVVIGRRYNDFGGEWTDSLYGRTDAAPFACMYPTSEVPPVDTPSAICRTDYVDYDGNCYYFTRDHLTYTDAVTYCQDNNSTIISIHSPQMEKFLSKKLTALFYPKQVNLWTGMYLDNGEFKNEDGTFIDYTNWDDKSPSDRSDRVQMVVANDKTTGWTDLVQSAATFVCTYSP